MDSYATIGLLLLFSTFILGGCILLKARRLRTGLHDEEIKRVTKIIRLRNAAMILSLCAYSTFFLLLSSMPKLTLGSTEYVLRDNIGDLALVIGYMLLIVAAMLWYLSRSKMLQLKLQVRRDAIRARMRARQQRSRLRNQSRRNMRV